MVAVTPKNFSFLTLLGGRFSRVIAGLYPHYEIPDHRLGEREVLLGKRGGLFRIPPDDRLRQLWMLMERTASYPWTVRLRPETEANLTTRLKAQFLQIGILGRAGDGQMQGLVGRARGSTIIFGISVRGEGFTNGKHVFGSPALGRGSGYLAFDQRPEIHKQLEPIPIRQQSTSDHLGGLRPPTRPNVSPPVTPPPDAHIVGSGEPLGRLAYGSAAYPEHRGKFPLRRKTLTRHELPESYSRNEPLGNTFPCRPDLDRPQRGTYRRHREGTLPGVLGRHYVSSP